jgi:hypothetical protein
VINEAWVLWRTRRICNCNNSFLSSCNSLVKSDTNCCSMGFMRREANITNYCEFQYLFNWWQCDWMCYCCGNEAVCHWTQMFMFSVKSFIAVMADLAFLLPIIAAGLLAANLILITLVVFFRSLWRNSEWFYGLSGKIRLENKSVIRNCCAENGST